ncbi:MAG: TOBE domain-containing protein [Candidatus Baldrarchaeia archaeon]
MKIERDGLMGKVRVRIEEPFTITVVVTAEAIEELEIKPGDVIEAVVVATEVIIKKEK